MGSPTRASADRIWIVLLALAIVGWTAIGPGVAAGQGAESFAVRQGDRCVPMTPLVGEEPVREFYDYHSTIEDNPYTTAIGPSFSSEGTLDLQAAETSLLFLYAGPDGDLSLVMVHGAREAGVDGGSASFELSGLPADGRWAVKDDEYDSPENADDWTHGETTASIDWTWSRSATDGGAFSGLGDEFNVTVEPAFNGDAALFGQVNWGVVENWTVLSGDRANPNRTPLDLAETVTVSSEPCDGTAVTTEDVDGGTVAGNGDDDLDDGDVNRNGGEDDGDEGDRDRDKGDRDRDEGDRDRDEGDRDRDEGDRDRDEGDRDHDRDHDGDRDRDRHDDGRGDGFGFGHDDDAPPWFDDDDDDDEDEGDADDR